MSSRDREATTDLVSTALARAGQRGILLTGWDGMSGIGLSQRIYAIDSVPHDWLFPRVAAVVHHGGAGTTAASLRMGVPSVIVPFIADQPFWGQTVHQLGVGPRPIPRAQLTVERLAAAIQVATGDEAMRRRSDALGRRIRSEDGVTRAVETFQQFFREVP
jgi:UDP:flavonoid glycosyltransferase YjiC (YdhE family)